MVNFKHQNKDSGEIWSFQVTFVFLYICNTPNAENVLQISNSYGFSLYADNVLEVEDGQ